MVGPFMISGLLDHQVVEVRLMAIASSDVLPVPIATDDALRVAGHVPREEVHRRLDIGARAGANHELHALIARGVVAVVTRADRAGRRRRED
jgi:hypothetical protein